MIIRLDPWRVINKALNNLRKASIGLMWKSREPPDQNTSLIITHLDHKNDINGKSESELSQRNEQTFQERKY